MTAPSDREMFGGILASQLSTVAYRLRSLADQFDRFAADVPTTDAPSDVRASDIAARAVHALAWGLANASLDGVVRAAADYDKYVPAPSGH